MKRRELFKFAAAAPVAVAGMSVMADSAPAANLPKSYVKDMQLAYAELCKKCGTRTVLYNVACDEMKCRSCGDVWT